ncbi:MAG: phosphoglycerate kinase [Chitinophagaceae bacterium]|nr:phosphoglycerate kinase [Chitinophagaceae bacterium]
MKTVNTFNFKNKKTLVRVDFNVPLDKNFHITDTTRLQSHIPTIKKILTDGGSVIVMSHLGRPKDGYEEKYSLKHILLPLSKILNQEVFFAEDCIGTKAYHISQNIKPGEVLLLENLRFYKEEEKGDELFSQKLSKHADVYVNDAFATAHRSHASTTIVAKFFTEKICGIVMEAELNALHTILEAPKRPFTAILGGAKVSDKILLIEQLLKKADHIIIGGGMAYTFLKAQGINIGNSLVETDKIEFAQNILKTTNKIILPKDSVIAHKFQNDTETQTVLNHNMKDGWMGLDIGNQTIEAFGNIIKQSKTILWNGPMGVFEMENFSHGTKKIAELIAQTTQKGAFSLVGGGDSVAAINTLGFADKISYVSTGGGALLEFIEGKTLPGIKILQ